MTGEVFRHVEGVAEEASEDQIRAMLDDQDFPIHNKMRKALEDSSSSDRYLSLVGAKQDEPLRQGAPVLLPPPLLRQQ